MVALLYWWYRRRLRRAREIPDTHAPMPPSNESLGDSWPAHALGRSASRAEERSVRESAHFTRAASRHAAEFLPRGRCLGSQPARQSLVAISAGEIFRLGGLPENGHVELFSGPAESLEHTL
jgi:hypothetical protein